MIKKIAIKCKNIFSEIIKDHWEDFKSKHRKYDTPQYTHPIEKALTCGMEEGGYTEYICMDCGEGMKRVPFSCKSAFCLSCSKVYVDEVVSQVSKSHTSQKMAVSASTMHHLLRLMRECDNSSGRYGIESME